VHTGCRRVEGVGEGVRLDLDGTSCGQALVERARALRLDSDHPNAGCAARDSGDEPTSTGWDHDHLRLRSVLEDLAAEARVAVDDERVVEGMDELSPGGLA
jgi:hypothetical protein